MAEHDKKTELGNFHQDPSGLWHYNFRSVGLVARAANDAMEHRPEGVAIWFWFNGSPCPMFPTDDRPTLLSRWDKWRTAYQSNPASLLSLLEETSKQIG
jgi:hypothetical protein